MDIKDVTKKQVEEWSDEEVMLWGGVFQQQDQAARMRKTILGIIEVRDEKRKSHCIHVDSTVID